MKVLVIGGTGFMGPHVVKLLAEMGHDVTILHTGQHEADLPEQVRHIHSDTVARPVTSIPQEAKDLRPDVVLHMVPIGEADARVVVDAFKGAAKRLVAISSMDVYRIYGVLNDTEEAPLEVLPITEESPLRQKLYPYKGETPREKDDPRWWFDLYDKILVERVVMAEPQLPGTVLRLPMVYGPRTQRDSEFLKRMVDGRNAILMDEKTANWRAPRGYSEDMAHAIALAVTDGRAAGRAYHVAEPEQLTYEEWVRRIGRAAGWEGDIVVLRAARMPEHLKPTENIVQDWLVDTSRIRDELGYAEKVGQEEGLKCAVEWQRANPPEQIDPSAFDYAAEDAALAERG